MPKKFKRSFGFAKQGLKYVYRTERNFRIQIIIAAIALATAFALDFSYYETALVIGMIALVFITEITNSVLEQTLDIIESKHHPDIGRAKDMMAGAVLIAATAAVAVGVILIYQHL